MCKRAMILALTVLILDLLLFPGGSPGAGYFLLRGQKKVTKEKAAPVSRA